MRATLAVHSWNEADALERLLLSSLAAAPLFDEWVVLDHRSSDHTQSTLDELETVLAAHGVRLTRLHEANDLSRELPFAKIRDRTLKAASNTVVALMDADFILGVAFATALETALARITARARPVSAISLTAPVVWDHLATDHLGVIVDHGRVWVHSAKPRIMHRDRVSYVQSGKREHHRFRDPNSASALKVDNDGSVLISANIKPQERIDLRKTMTMFMEDAMSGKERGKWLEAHAAGRTREMPAYRYGDVDLRGVHLNLARLAL